MTTGDDWRRLNKDYRDNVLRSGPGSLILPNWRDLLERIAIRYYGRRGQKRFKEMLKRNGIQFDKVILPHVCDHFVLRT